MKKKINKHAAKEIRSNTRNNTGKFLEEAVTHNLYTALENKIKRVKKVQNIEEHKKKAEGLTGADFDITIKSFATFSFQAKKIYIDKNQHHKPTRITLAKDKTKKQIEDCIEYLTKSGKSSQSFQQLAKDVLKNSSFSQLDLLYLNYLLSQKATGRRVLPFILFYTSHQVRSFYKLADQRDTLLIASVLKLYKLDVGTNDLELDLANHKHVKLLKCIYQLPEDIGKFLTNKKDGKFKTQLRTILGNNVGRIYFGKIKRDEIQSSISSNSNDIKHSTERFISNFIYRNDHIQAKSNTRPPKRIIDDLLRRGKEISGMYLERQRYLSSSQVKTFKSRLQEIINAERDNRSNLSSLILVIDLIRTILTNINEIADDRNVLPLKNFLFQTRFIELEENRQSRNFQLLNERRTYNKIFLNEIERISDEVRGYEFSTEEKYIEGFSKCSIVIEPIK